MSANERAIVANTHHVVDGGSGDALRKVLYALYVSAFLLMTYGVTLAHAFFMTQDPDWLRAQGYDVDSLSIVESMNPETGEITFRD